MADDKAEKGFSGILSGQTRKAKLEEKIAGLSGNMRGTKFAKILSAAQPNLKTNVARGYLTSFTGVVDDLEDVPPAQWGEYAKTIALVLSLAENDPSLKSSDAGKTDLNTLNQIEQDLISEIERQRKFTNRAQKALGNAAKRLGRRAVEGGADYRSYGGMIARTFAFAVRRVSKIALAGLNRQDRKAEARKSEATSRAQALGTAGTERKYGRMADEQEAASLAPQQLAAVQGTEENTQGILDFLKPAGQLNLFGDDSPQLIKLTDAIVDQTNTAVKLDDEKQSRDLFAATEAAEEAKPSRVERLLEKILGKTGKGGKREGGLLAGLFGAFGKLLTALTGTIPKIIALGAVAVAAKVAWDWIDDKVEALLPNLGDSAKTQAKTTLVRGANVARQGAGIWGGRALRGLGRGLATATGSVMGLLGRGAPPTAEKGWQKQTRNAGRFGPYPEKPQSIWSKMGTRVARGYDRLDTMTGGYSSKMLGVPAGLLKQGGRAGAGLARNTLRVSPRLNMIGAGMGMWAAWNNIKEQERIIEELRASGLEGVEDEIAQREASIAASWKSGGVGAGELTLALASRGRSQRIAGLTALTGGIGVGFDVKSIYHANQADNMAAERSGLGDDSPLQIKPGAGDPRDVQPGVMDFAQDVGTIPGFNQITALKDRAGGKHGRGLAMDFTINENEISSEDAVAAVYAKAQMAGLRPGDIYVKDEYKTKSKEWTAPHIHVQFKNPEVAARMMEPDAPRLAQDGGGRPAGRDAASLTSRNQGQDVYVMNHQPTTVSAPVVQVNGGGTTIMPMRINPDSINAVLLGITRMNFV